MKHLALLVLIFYSTFSLSQVVNAYAKVTGITGAVLTLSNVDEAAHTFENGEWVVIMQMQGNVIGTTTNDAAFGSLGTIQSTGLYEIRQISTHTEAAGLPTTITLMSNPINTYNFSANTSVQIISFRAYGNPNYTT